MGQVTVQPRALSECMCWQCVSEDAMPVRHRVNAQAAQDAANLLGIRRDVLVETGVIRVARGNPLGGMAGWDKGHWLVLLDDRTLNRHHTLSQTLWHELGHVLDVEKRIDETGECISPEHATDCLMRAVEQQRDWYDYVNSREEKFANAIMDRYGHINLEQGGHRGYTTSEHLRPAGRAPYEELAYTWRAFTGS